MTWLSDIAVVIALPLFALVFAAVAVLAHTALRPFLPPAEVLRENHDVAGFLMGVVGVLYSVVLGFLVGAVWTAFATAQQTADLEAGYIGDAFNFAGQLASPQRRLLQRDIARYAIAVRDASALRTTWQSADATGTLLYDATRQAVTAQPPENASNAVILENNTLRGGVIETLRQLGDTRRLRLVQARSRLPDGMLEALILGAIGVMAFTFLFGVKSYVKQMTLTALLAGSIGLFFGLIIELSTPYSGALQVSRDALRLVIANNHLDDFAR
jgi:Protein of unknown function (DUF4239)